MEIKEVKSGNHIINDKIQIAKSFSEFSCINITRCGKFLGPRLVNSMYMIPCDALGVRKVIIGIDSNRAHGIDNIGVKTLKECAEHLVKPTTFVINACLEKGIFPDCLKTDVIIPLHKSGDKTRSV